MKDITNIYGESLKPYFEKTYGDRGNEIYNVAQLLADYFYNCKRQYHCADSNYLEIEKTWNRGMGRGRLLVFYPSKNEFWINKGLANKKDMERLNTMISDNSLSYNVVTKSYDLWDRKWN